MPPNRVVHPDTQAAWERKVEKRLAALEGSPQLVQSSIKEGAFRVLDRNGQMRLLLGKEPTTGNYGLFIYQGLTLAADNDIVAATYAPQAADVAALEGRNSTSYGDLATAGPAVTVTVSATGNLLIACGCRANIISANDSACHMGYAFTGANSLAAADSRAAAMVVNLPADTTILGAGIAITRLHTGLAPGITTITAKYRNDGTDLAAGSFTNRWLFAIPL